MKKRPKNSGDKKKILKASGEKKGIYKELGKRIVPYYLIVILEVQDGCLQNSEGK